MKIADLRAQFVTMDKNGDGALNLDELHNAAEKCGLEVGKRELEQVMFALRDASGNKQREDAKTVLYLNLLESILHKAMFFAIRLYPPTVLRPPA